MSIISDALRKAAEKRKNITKLTEEELYKDYSVDIKELASKKTRQPGWGSLGALFIAGLALATFFYNVDLPLNLYPRTPPATVAPGQIMPKEDAVKDDVAKETFSPAVLESGRKDSVLYLLKLNGIIKGAGEPLAIIDNRILRKGDYVHGAQITSISSDSVTVLYSDKEIILKIE